MPKVINWSVSAPYTFYDVIYHFMLSADDMGSQQDLTLQRTSCMMKTGQQKSWFGRQWACNCTWALSSEFVSSRIPSWPILTAHAQPFRGAMDLAFCLKVSLDSLLVWASSEGSGETARMRRLAWTFAARIGYKYQIRLTRSTCSCSTMNLKKTSARL